MIATAVSAVPCERLSFQTESAASAYRRRVAHELGAQVRPFKCCECRAWHLKFSIQLSERELVVLRKMALGYSGREIATQMGAPHKAMQQLMVRMGTKQGTLSRANLVAIAVLIGEVTLFQKEDDGYRRDSQDLQ